MHVQKANVDCASKEGTALQMAVAMGALPVRKILENFKARKVNSLF